MRSVRSTLRVACVMLAAFALSVSLGRGDPPASKPFDGLAPDARAVVVSSRPAGRASAQPKPIAQGAGETLCTVDGASCISLASYDADMCRVMETAAQGNGIDPYFFLRLVWKESLFDFRAISPAGAQGIAQFMPDTARLRGLVDPFNPAEALVASARYLADLSRAYGNIGLAAVAYNGGEARAERFIAHLGGLPNETRAYVAAITGHTAETWRNAPPSTLDLSIAPDGTFREACLAHAASRNLREYPASEALMAWGVILASNVARDGLERQISRLRNRHGTVLADEHIAVARSRLPGMPRRLYNAQVGRESRAGAEALCTQLRAASGACIVLRN